jgi:hypothetical protein
VCVWCVWCVCGVCVCLCSELPFRFQRRNCTPLFKKCYNHYFGCEVGDQDKHCASHICATCVRLLTGWVSGSRQLQFFLPTVWREPKDGSSCCDFRLTNINRCHLQIQTDSEIFIFSVCNEVCPTQGRVACTKDSGKSDFKRWQLWFRWRSWTARKGKCWLRSDIWYKLLLTWTPFIKTAS